MPWRRAAVAACGVFGRVIVVTSVSGSCGGLSGFGCARGHTARHVESGGQSGKQNVEAAVEFGQAVVGGPGRGEVADVREFADRQPVQPEPHHVVGFLGAFDDLLQFGEHVAVEESEQCAVYVQCVGPGEAASGQQGEDLFEVAQDARWPHAERCRQGAGDQQGHHVGVGACQVSEVVAQAAQGGDPVRCCGVQGELFEDHLDHPVEHGRLVRHVPVERHRITPERFAEASHRQRVDAVAVDDVQGTGQDASRVIGRFWPFSVASALGALSPGPDGPAGGWVMDEAPPSGCGCADVCSGEPRMADMSIAGQPIRTRALGAHAFLRSTSTS